MRDFLILKEKEKKIKKKINKLIEKYLKFLTRGDGYDGAIHIKDGLFIALSDETYDVFNLETHLKGFKSFDKAYNYIKKTFKKE